jgi:hypothetical protein
VVAVHECAVSRALASKENFVGLTSWRFVLRLGSFFHMLLQRVDVVVPYWESSSWSSSIISSWVEVSSERGDAWVAKEWGLGLVILRNGELTLGSLGCWIMLKNAAIC